MGWIKRTASYTSGLVDEPLHEQDFTDRIALQTYYSIFKISHPNAEHTMSDDDSFSNRISEMREMLADLNPEERIFLILAGIRTLGDRFTAQFFDDEDFQFVSVKEPTPGTKIVTFSFVVRKFYTNIMGSLHGGAQASIFDALTTLALQAVSTLDKGQWMEGGGVSRTLNVTYLRPAPIDEKVLCECEVVHAGKRLCFLRSTMRREKDGAVISTCEHNKSVVERAVDWKL